MTLSVASEDSTDKPPLAAGPSLWLHFHEERNFFQRGLRDVLSINSSPSRSRCAVDAGKRGIGHRKSIGSGAGDDSHFVGHSWIG